MPGTDDLQSFLEEKLLVFDPDIDLSDGSPAQTDIIDPVVRRFTPDPFEMNVYTFIRARLLQEYPDLSVEEGEALADLLIKPMEVLLDPVIREVEFLRKNKSLNDPDLMAPEEADSLMGNFFVSRTRGEKSVGQARLYFNAPVAVTVSVGNEFATSDGLKFIPSTSQEISAEAMLFNQDGNLFYFDVAVEAESEGDEYNIGVGELASVTNVPSSVKVTNLSRFRDGVPEESTLSFIERGEDSLTERSLVVPRGAISRLFDQFGDLQHLQVVGFNDTEMQRDIIKGGGLGPIVIYGTDGRTSDDGDGDGFSDLFESATGGFIANVGAIGEVSGFMLTLQDKDYPVIEVVSDSFVKVGAALEPGAEMPSPAPPPDMPDNLTAQPFYIRRLVLTISDIPGGLVNPTGISGTVQIASDEVHIGGISDFYLRGTELEEEELVIEAVSDELPLMEGLGLKTKVAGLPADVVEDPDLLSTNDFVAKKVKTGMTLVIETDAGNAGAYQIIKVAPGGDSKRLQVDPEPSSTVTEQRYKIVDEIDVDLLEPKTLRGDGTDLKTTLGSAQVSTVSEVDFDQLGTEEEDTLRILGNTLNKGDYSVDQITGTGNKLLVLGEELRRTSSSEQWLLFKKGAGIEPPLVRIKTIDILDSSKQPTGDTIPYAEPVDVQTSAFSNIGVGKKLEFADARIGIIGGSDLFAPWGVNGQQLKLKINGGALTWITFSGVAVIQDIMDQIDAAVGKKIAEQIPSNDGGGAIFLGLRSRNNWIQVDPSGSANLFLGLSTSYWEDNRQVRSWDGDVPDFTANTLDLEVEKDSVYILTGDNIEFWYLQEIYTNRFLISRVDEGGKAVFPLWDRRASIRIGSRSFGKVRCYFLEPTSFEVRGDYRRAVSKVSDPPVAGEHAPNAVFGEVPQDEEPRTEFSWDIYDDQSAYHRFFPDPALNHYILPTGEESIADNLDIVTLGDKFVESEKNLVSPQLGAFSRSNEIDFLLREVLPGDILEVTHQPRQGTADLRDGFDLDYGVGGGTDPVGKTLIFSLENGPDKTVTFSNDVDGPTRLVSEINNQLGATLAYEEDDTTTGKKHLRLEADFDFVLRATGTATSLLMGLTSAGDNDANAKGKYVISEAGFISGAITNHMRLSIAAPLGVDPTSWTGFTSGQLGPSQHFKIYRPGVQRVSSTEMQDNQEGSLYYADIELVSFGAGDEFNIEADLQLEAAFYKSDGYRLHNEDNNLTFSIYEEPKMKISRRVLTPGSTDSPENMTLVSQQNLQVNYERSDLVSQVQSFALSELDRVLCANILVRHLIPHFVQFDLTYQGGSKTSVVEEDIDDLIDGLLPDEVLEASAVANIPRRRNAQRVELPLVLIGVVHGVDRKVQIDRSEDAISRGRLATFIKDVLNITRQTTSS
jgi:hypothetical protein